MAEINVTSQNFEEEVLHSDKPVLIDFWATWCGPCRMIAPHVAAIAEECADTLKVAKVNVDEEEQLASSFRITSIPTLVLMKNGEVVTQTMGYRTKEQILELLK